MVGLQDLVQGEYSEASQFFEASENLRRAWTMFAPAPPLRRSDMALLGTLAHLTKKEEGPVTLSALAKAMHQSLPGISQKASMLGAQGYVRRLPGESDRRVTCLEMTGKGREIAALAVQDFIGRVQQALDRLGKEETKQLLFLLNKLGDAIQKTEGTDEDCLNLHDT